MFSAVSSGNSWAVTSNAGADAKKLVAELSAAMTSGVSLIVNVAAPEGGTAVEAVLSAINTQANVVTLIDSVGQSGMLITYQLQATLAAGEVGIVSDNTVIYTILDTAG